MVNHFVFRLQVCFFIHFLFYFECDFFLLVSIWTSFADPLPWLSTRLLETFGFVQDFELESRRPPDLLCLGPPHLNPHSSAQYGLLQALENNGLVTDKTCLNTKSVHFLTSGPGGPGGPCAPMSPILPCFNFKWQKQVRKQKLDWHIQWLALLLLLFKRPRKSKWNKLQCSTFTKLW